MVKIWVYLTAVYMAMMLGCTASRYAKTAIGESMYGAEVIQFEGGEVYCGQGAVCTEVEVLRVDSEKRDGGRVDVTLHNRTGDRVAVQVMVEIMNAQGVRLDASVWQNVALQPRQQTVWSMPGIYHMGGSVRVMLRTLE